MNLGFKVICKMTPSKKEKERKRRREKDEEKETKRKREREEVGGKEWYYMQSRGQAGSV